LIDLPDKENPMNIIDPDHPTLDSGEHDDEKATIAPSPTRETSPPAETADTIREVILGPKLREDEKRFRMIESELEHLHQLFKELSLDVETKLNHRIEEIDADLRKELREFENQINEQINQLVSEVMADSRKISIMADTLSQELQGKIDKLGDTHAAQIGELRDQIRRNCDTLRNELITETDTLDENKISRVTLADDLIALGMKLKDGVGLDD
jgi:gas vesicle protein